MDAFLTSLTVVAIAEIGDRTQLLALLLASQFRRPVPILCGILLATLANHAAAALAGEWIGDLLSPGLLRWGLVLSFAGMAVWMLIPESPSAEDTALPRYGAFLTTLVGFFICEVGDRTQIATVALAARFDLLLPVVLGTTTGMMLANAPTVLFGHYAGSRVGGRSLRFIAAALFAIEAGLVLLGHAPF
jgi:Ca2+/H+ antiporter, TMEM165/GDT1 family